jgi:hypothetical protein
MQIAAEQGDLTCRSRLWQGKSYPDFWFPLPVVRVEQKNKKLNSQKES